MASYLQVSLLIPCHNEEQFIGKCLESVLASDYPKDRLEVLVIDGLSRDRTREIVRSYAQSHSFVRLLDNPKKIFPAALNIGIKEAQGDLIFILSSHAAYKQDYISQCVKYSQEFGADNVGGIMVTLPRTGSLLGRIVAKSLAHRFGVGDSAFRTGVSQPSWVDTVFGGCYRRKVFQKVGLFNEDLISSSDMEFNLRLKKAGGKTFLAPAIISYYYARSDFKSFLKNNFRNGLWAILPFRHSDIIPVSLRHLIPLAFVLSLGGSALLSFFLPAFGWFLIIILGIYLLAAFIFSFEIALKERDLRYLVIMPFVFFSLHLSYGLGSLAGLFRVVFSRKLWARLLKPR